MNAFDFIGRRPVHEAQGRSGSIDPTITTPGRGTETARGDVQAEMPTIQEGDQEGDDQESSDDQNEFGDEDADQRKSFLPNALLLNTDIKSQGAIDKRSKGKKSTKAQGKSRQASRVHGEFVDLVKLHFQAQLWRHSSHTDGEVSADKGLDHALSELRTALQVDVDGHKLTWEYAAADKPKIRFALSSEADWERLISRINDRERIIHENFTLKNKLPTSAVTRMLPLMFFPKEQVSLYLTKYGYRYTPSGCKHQRMGRSNRQKVEIFNRPTAALINAFIRYPRTEGLTEKDHPMDLEIDQIKRVFRCSKHNGGMSEQQICYAPTGRWSGLHIKFDHSTIIALASYMVSDAHRRRP